jgi:glutaredoxin
MPGISGCGQFQVGFADAATFRRELEELLTIRVFSREGCPHCRDARRFLAEVVARRPALRVEVLDVVRDSTARAQMEQLARRHGKRVTGLPVILAAGQLFVGYQTDATTGRRIEAVFEPPTAPPPAGKTSHVEPGSIVAPFQITGRMSAVGGPQWWAFALISQIEAPADAELPPSPPPASELPPPPPPADQPSSTLAEENLPEETADAIELPHFGPIRLHDWGLPLFTLIIGLVDGFNPCAMWVLVFLLSVLVNVRSRLRILAIAGTFVVVSGLAYYAFMAAWLNVFMLFGLIRPLQVALGCVALCIGALNVKDFFAFKQGVSLSIPESAKPGIYQRVRTIVSARSLSLAVSAAVVLAVMVNVVELLCTAGLPALYTEILTLQNLPPWQNYAYLALYIIAYMFDDTLLLTGFVVTLSHRKLQEREGRWLKLLSGLVIGLLGLVMIFKPDWLHWGGG